MSSTGKRNLTIYIFASATAFFWFSLYAYVPELSTYGETLGASYRLIGIIGGSYGLTQLLLRIPLGILSDAVGKRKPFILMGLAVSFISSIVTFLNPAPLSLLTTRLLAGVAASTWVLFTVLFSSYFKPEEAKKSVGIINGYNAAGQLVAMSIGGFVSQAFGTRYLFLLSAVGAVIALVFGLFIQDSVHEKKYVSIKAFLNIAKRRQLLKVSWLAILSQLITFATAFGFVPILARQLGASNLQLSILTIIGIIPAVFVSRMAGDYFPRTIGIKATLASGLIGSAVICSAMPFVGSLPLLYVLQFFSGVSRSLVFPLLMGLGIDGIEHERRAMAMGTFQALYGIGMVFGPVLLGFIAQAYGLHAGFIFTGIIGLSGLIVVRRL